MSRTSLYTHTLFRNCCGTNSESTEFADFDSIQLSRDVTSRSQYRHTHLDLLEIGLSNYQRDDFRLFLFPAAFPAREDLEKRKVTRLRASLGLISSAGKG